MVFVWYPMGVAKLVDATKVIATKNGWGSTCMDDASDSAIGERITAEALFDITSVNISSLDNQDRVFRLPYDFLRHRTEKHFLKVGLPMGANDNSGDLLFFLNL
jgi:hypothetical protein